MFDKDDFHFPAALCWQDSRDRLLRITFVEEREPRMLGASSQEQNLLPVKDAPINALMGSGLLFLKINRSRFTELNSALEKIVVTANSYNTSVVVAVCCYRHTSGYASG